MATKKRAFISFDVDHDEGTKKMLALYPVSTSWTDGDVLLR